MAVYRQLHTSFWQDPFIIERTPEEKYFYIYLMTNSKTRQCGCYEISKTVMVMETGFNLETVNKLLERFINYGKIEYCERTNEILIKNWLRYNSHKSPRVRQCIEREIRDIKHKKFADYVSSRLTIDYVESMATEQQKEKEKEEEKEEEVKEEVTTTERESLNILRSIPNYKFKYAEDLDFIRTLAVDYPSLDIVYQLKKWRDYKRDKPLTAKSSPRSQLRNWFKKAAEFEQERRPQQNKPIELWTKAEREALGL